MSFRNKQVTSVIEGAIARSANFEVTISDITRRSERRAWIVAFSAVLMSLILAGGYFYFLPLKEKVPYLVMADAYGTWTPISQFVNYQWIPTYMAICPKAMGQGQWTGPGSGATVPYVH